MARTRARKAINASAANNSAPGAGSAIAAVAVTSPLRAVAIKRPAVTRVKSNVVCRTQHQGDITAGVRQSIAEGERDLIDDDVTQIEETSEYQAVAI